MKKAFSLKRCGSLLTAFCVAFASLGVNNVMAAREDYEDKDGFFDSFLNMCGPSSDMGVFSVSIDSDENLYVETGTKTNADGTMTYDGDTKTLYVKGTDKESEENFGFVIDGVDADVVIDGANGLKGIGVCHSNVNVNGVNGATMDVAVLSTNHATFKTNNVSYSFSGLYSEDGESTVYPAFGVLADISNIIVDGGKIDVKEGSILGAISDFTVNGGEVIVENDIYDENYGGIFGLPVGALLLGGDNGLTINGGKFEIKDSIFGLGVATDYIGYLVEDLLFGEGDFFDQIPYENLGRTAINVNGGELNIDLLDDIDFSKIPSSEVENIFWTLYSVIPRIGIVTGQNTDFNINGGTVNIDGANIGIFDDVDALLGIFTDSEKMIQVFGGDDNFGHDSNINGKFNGEVPDVEAILDRFNSIIDEYEEAGYDMDDPEVVKKMLDEEVDMIGQIENLLSVGIINLGDGSDVVFDGGNTNIDNTSVGILSGMSLSMLFMLNDSGVDGTLRLINELLGGLIGGGFDGYYDELFDIMLFASVAVGDAPSVTVNDGNVKINNSIVGIHGINEAIEFNGGDTLITATGDCAEIGTCYAVGVGGGRHGDLIAMNNGMGVIDDTDAKVVEKALNYTDKEIISFFRDWDTDEVYEYLPYLRDFEGYYYFTTIGYDDFDVNPVATPDELSFNLKNAAPSAHIAFKIDVPDTGWFTSEQSATVVKSVVIIASFAAIAGAVHMAERKRRAWKKVDFKK